MSHNINQENNRDPANHPAGLKTALYAIFFLSGVAGLGYQMAWTRMFAVGLGHEIPSVLAVVAAFFGGLALGSWILDGPISRSSRPAHWYVALEVLIGIWGFVSIALIGSFNTLAIHLIGLEPSPLWHWAVAFLLPLAALLPATTAMGATLPAMERCVAPLTRDGRCVGGLYAINTAGAMCGTLASAFAFLPLFGFRATVMALAGINIACAAVILIMRLPALQTPETPPEQLVQQTQIPPWRIGTIIFFTGLLGIGYEVLGVRVMSQMLENTVYSFAAVLSIYLLGTAAGAAAYQRFGRRFDYPLLLGYLLCGISAACMVGILLLSAAKPVYAHLRRGVFGDSLFGVMASEMVIAAMIFAVPTLLMGATFSHLVQGAKRRTNGIGRAAAVNTLGAALAPLVFGVVLLPLLGAKWVLVILALSYLVLIPRNAGVKWFAEAAPIALVFVLPANLQVITKYANDKVIDYREGVMAAVAVVQESDGNRGLRVNNRFQMGNTRGAVEESLQAHIPLLLHPEPKRALFLGLGSAITYRAAAFQPGLHADGVELVPEIVDVLHHFQPTNLPPDFRTRQRIYIADARRFVRATDNQYDVIIADLFHPGRDGAGTLYTTEHFQAVRDRLAPDGLFCQWLPLYQLSDPMLRVILRTFLDVFPHTNAYLMDFRLDHPAIGLIASAEPSHYPADWYKSRVNDDQLRGVLRGLLLHDGVRLFGACLAGPDDLRQFAGDGPINTDDQPIVMFGAPKFTNRLGTVTPYGRLVNMLDQCRINPANLIKKRDSEELIDRIDRFVAARDIYFRGLVASAHGKDVEAVNQFVKSVETSKDFLTGYAHCLGLVRSEARDDPKGVTTLLKRLIAARPEQPEARRMLQQIAGS